MRKASGSQKSIRKRLLSIKEVAEEYGVTVWFWRQRIYDGTLPYVKTGRKQLIDRFDIDHYISTNKVTMLTA